MCKVTVPRLIVWPKRQCSSCLRERCVACFQSLFGPGKFSVRNPAHFVCSVIVLMFGGQGKDSNLRCDLGRIATLASCCLKPLSHLSSNSYFTSARLLRNILAATDLAFQSFAHSFTWCRQARTRLQLNCRASEERDVADSPAKRVVDRVDSSANGASENILRGTA